jgi:hypothetical protein
MINRKKVFWLENPTEEKNHQSVFWLVYQSKYIFLLTSFDNIYEK